jgi:hypothetical protein
MDSKFKEILNNAFRNLNLKVPKNIESLQYCAKNKIAGKKTKNKYGGAPPFLFQKKETNFNENDNDDNNDNGIKTKTALLFIATALTAFFSSGYLRPYKNFNLIKQNFEILFSVSFDKLKKGQGFFAIYNGIFNNSVAGDTNKKNFFGSLLALPFNIFTCYHVSKPLKKFYEKIQPHLLKIYAVLQETTKYAVENWPTIDYTMQERFDEIFDEMFDDFQEFQEETKINIMQDIADPAANVPDANAVAADVNAADVNAANINAADINANDVNAADINIPDANATANVADASVVSEEVIAQPQVFQPSILGKRKKDETEDKLQKEYEERFGLGGKRKSRKRHRKQKKRKSKKRVFKY